MTAKAFEETKNSKLDSPFEAGGGAFDLEIINISTGKKAGEKHSSFHSRKKPW